MEKMSKGTFYKDITKKKENELEDKNLKRQRKD